MKREEKRALSTVSPCGSHCAFRKMLRCQRDALGWYHFARLPPQSWFPSAPHQIGPTEGTWPGIQLLYAPHLLPHFFSFCFLFSFLLSLAVTISLENSKNSCLHMGYKKWLVSIQLLCCFQHIKTFYVMLELCRRKKEIFFNGIKLGWKGF